MDKRLYVAWNNFTKHQLSCPKRCQWLDAFLSLAFKQKEFRFPQFFRGMSSVLIEQLLYDMSQINYSALGVDKDKLTYCLRNRGWLLLHALASSNLRSLVGVADLTDLLINLYQVQTENEPSVVDPIALWPITDLGTVVTRGDLKNVKKPRPKQSRRSARLKDIKYNSSVDCIDGEETIQPMERCCRPDDEDEIDKEWNQVELPCLSAESFSHLALSLLEQLVGHHGDFRLKSSRCLDHRVLNFALQRLRPDLSSQELRRLFRLILRCMVSVIQHRRPLQTEEIIQQLVETAATSCADFSADVVEGLVRFLAAIYPIDDDSLFHQWLNSFHSQTCLRLIVNSLESDTRDSSWFPLIGTIIANVSGRNKKIPCHHHHIFGHALTDPAQFSRESCSISSLFYILMQIYHVGNEHLRKLVLKAINSGGQPCCCFPPDLIYQTLFGRVSEVPEFLDALQVVFRSTGFSNSSNSATEFQCHFCRYNGGLELERCRQMGVYASTESLSKSCWNVALPDPWRSFDFYTEYVLVRMDQPFSLSMVKHIQQLIAIGTTQVKSEIFARVFYPILTLSPSGSANTSDRSSIAGQITEACWQMTATLVQQRSICELFLSSNGLELLLDLCRSPEWSWNVARVLQSMISLQCQADEDVDLIENVDIKMTGMGEATALAILEHLLIHHVSYILRSLQNQSADSQWDFEIPELHAATETVGSFDSVWVDHLKSFEYLAGNLKTASALWETTVRLFVHNQAFSSWFANHTFVKWFEQIILALCRHLSRPDAHHWMLYAELLELFLTLFFLSSAPNRHPLLKKVMEHFTPRHNLSFIYEMLLRCSTLERWITPENHARPARSFSVRNETFSDGYEADEEPGTLEPTTSLHRSTFLFFPAVIPQLVVDFSSWLSRTADNEKTELFQEFLTSFTRMTSICSHPATATVLVNQGLLTRLLSEMKSILIHPDSSGIRQQLLGMISSLGGQRITPGELQLLVDMLKEDNPSWKPLLAVFLHLIQTDGYRPTHTLSFPGLKTNNDDEDSSMHLSSASIGSFVQVNDIRSEIYTMTKHAMELGRIHESKGVGSAWKCAAVFLPILTDSNWNMQTDGLSVSTWLLLSEAPRRKTRRFANPQWRSDLQDCTASFPWEDSSSGRDLHLFSMGSRNFLIEFWVDPVADNILLVRLSQSTHSQSQALATQTMDLKIPAERWNHLAVSCRQRSSVNGCHRVVHIQVFLNGYQSASLDLKVPLSPVKRIGNSHSFLLLGMAVASKNKSKRMTAPSWYLGNATVYKGELLTAELALLLMTLGPNGGIFLASCQDGQTRPNFPRFLHSKLVGHLQEWDRILDWDKLMDSLQSNLLMTYSAHKPESVFIYPCIISPTAGIFGSIMPSVCVFNAISSDPRSSQQPPIALSVALAAPLTAQYHLGIHAAMKQLGGYPVLLFLLGHAIESKADCQAEALEILLHWLRSDAQEAQLFTIKRGYWMLQHIFEAENCRPGKDFTAVLLNSSCSSPVVTKNPSHHCDAVIVDPHLLSFTIQCWKHWQRCRNPSEGNTLDVVLHALQHLLRDNHPYREFNVLQMERAGILQLILHLARECSLYQDCIPLTEHQAMMTADLVEGLLGSPPTVSALTTVVEYLLLLHPAEQTYCPTNSAGYSCFFLLSTRDPSVNIYQPRDWKLPEGYETFAPESSIPQPMNANRLGSALRDVIVKWSDDNEEIGNENIANNQTVTSCLPAASSSSSLSISIREEADTTLSLHLLRVLIACIRVLPDSMVKQVIGGIIRPDLLVVLARHKRDRMRAGAIRLLQAVLTRSEEEEQNFVKQTGILLLANQLQPYVATAPVVEACVGLCVGVDVILEQVLDPFAIWPENPTPLQLQSTILLLSLLPNAALDPALFHQLATLIRTLATRSNHILKFLLDFGLVETMGKSIVALAHANKSCPGDILEQREDEILLEAVHRILILIATRTVSASGAVPWTVFQDMIQLFHYMERVESGRCGFKARCVRMLHESCCVVLKQAIQTIQHRVEFHQLSRHQHQLFAFQPGTSHFQHVSDKILNTVLPFSLNRKMKLEKPPSHSEILERFRFLLTKAVDHITLNVELNTSSVEMAFSQDLLVTLVRGVSSILERPKSNGFRYLSSEALTDWSHYYAPDSSDPVRTLFWNSRQTLKTQLNRLVLFLSSPVQDPIMLHFVIKTLHDDPHHEELFKLIPPDETDFTYTLDTYLCHFLHSRKFTENVEHSTLIRIHCISRCLVPSFQRRRCQVLDPVQLKEQLEMERCCWWRTQEESQNRILSRYDPLLRQMADVAAKWTTLSVESQNGIRRLFLSRLRRDHGSKVLAAGGWIELVEQLTHQRAAWHFPKSYLRGWELDSTEGYQRMHLRLKRSALNVDAKYLLARSRSLLEPEKLLRPLESILRMSNFKSIDDALGHDDDKLVRTVNCWLVTTTEETSGELILTDKWMTFISPESSQSFSCIKYDNVREILTRRFQLQERALELFLCDSRTQFFVFNSLEERNCTHRELSELCPKLIPSESLAEVTQLWRESQITNFEYLVFLNKFAGRSYNDLMQYPIFPFVLADYESPLLDLNDPQVYRKFKKPMAVQNENRDQHYIENYNYLKRDFENRPEGSGPNFGPFHYGSLYSNPGIVLHFLVRLPPFTKLLMEYQDRNFDVPDRSFHSVGTSWRLASSDSTTDVKELIPEFFYLPEFLVNSLGFDFGMQQSGDPVDDVQLPPWSLGKPRLFIQIHRQALESSWVRDHLHHWIDLIFGFKQTGQAAIDSINVFHPSTYAGFDTTEGVNDDPIERNAKLTMIRSYGQVPRQLFRQPHPMSIQPLSAKSIRRNRSLLPSVNDLQWGCYVGSPSCQDPVLKHKESFAIPVHSFLPLRTGDTYAIGPFTTAILAHSYDKDSFLGRPTGILGVALISWGQSDGIVRIKIRKDEPVKPLFQSEVHDSVVLCSTAPDYNRIWVAYRSGIVRVYPFFFDPLRPHFELTGPPIVLSGHVGPLQQLVMCTAFSLAVSSGSDGSIILWDLHRLTFVRQLTPGLSSDRKDVILPVVQLAVSRDTADIACAVHLDEQQSRLELRSVNGQLIGMTTTNPLITSLCFSSAPEGISINVVAAGLSNGRIRLWDTWTLNVVRDITTDYPLSIVSLAYSSTSQHLLAARNDGFLLVWDSPHNHKKSPRYPPFINLTLQ